MSRVFITGANRGLGLEFVRQYADAGWQIVACCRSPEKASALHQLQKTAPDKIVIHRLDVSDFSAIDKLSKEFSDKTIDVLINNAGVYLGRGDMPGSIDYDDWERSLRINTLAPIRIAEAFLEQVCRSEKGRIVNISSLMGSVANNTDGNNYAYRSSKAALNMAVKSLSIDLADREVITIVLHPGWVHTDMGGDNAPLESKESVWKIRQVIETLSQDDSGRFLSYDGSSVDW